MVWYHYNLRHLRALSNKPVRRNPDRPRGFHFDAYLLAFQVRASPSIGAKKSGEYDGLLYITCENSGVVALVELAISDCRPDRNRFHRFASPCHRAGQGTAGGD
jgi:hypothetical protein